MDAVVAGVSTTTPVIANLTVVSGWSGVSVLAVLARIVGAAVAFLVSDAVANGTWVIAIYAIATPVHFTAAFAWARRD